MQDRIGYFDVWLVCLDRLVSHPQLISGIRASFRCMSQATNPVVDLGHGVTITFSFPGRNEISASLEWLGVSLVSGTLNPAAAHLADRVDDARVRADCGIDVDFLTGVVTWSGDVALAEGSGVTEKWVNIFNISNGALLNFDPAVGEIADSVTVNFPVVTSAEWSSSVLSSPTVVRIHVADGWRELANVGSIVKSEMFAAYSPFTFNVVACCGQTEPGQPGLYGNPNSVWFNIFFGIYQLDCAKADGWTRPFAYESANGVNSQPHHEDIVRLGKSDWNWFSNYVYGVPHDECAKYSAIDMSTITFTPQTTLTLGTSQWHHSTFSGIEVVSAYESNAAGAGQLVDNCVISPVWRESFGLPSPQSNFSASFIPTTLMASVDMAYWEDDDAFHTVVFGGTSAVDSPVEFITAQLAATRAIIATSYPQRGFPTI